MSMRFLIVGLTLTVPGIAMAQKAQSPEALLAGLGLEAEKTYYVFADAERDLLQKHKDALDAREQARQALAKIEGTAMMEQGIQELQAGQQQLQAEIAAARSSSSGMNYGRGRYSRYYRNQANAAIRQGQRQSDQLRDQIARARKQLPDEKQRQAAQAGVGMAMDQARESVKAVNDAYDALLERYQEVREKPGVLKAMEDVGRPKKLSYQLGPTEESAKAGKWAKGILKIRDKRPTASRRRPEPGPADAAKAADKPKAADAPR